MGSAADRRTRNSQFQCLVSTIAFAGSYKVASNLRSALRSAALQVPGIPDGIAWQEPPGFVCLAQDRWAH
jgi:hypothetical protein